MRNAERLHTLHPERMETQTQRVAPERVTPTKSLPKELLLVPSADARLVAE